MQYTADILLVTAVKVETTAVLEAFGKKTRRDPVLRQIGPKMYHDLGVLRGERLWLVQSEMGSAGWGASLQTVTQALRALSPHTVLMVGIAFGIDPTAQTIGDVLVAQRLVLYEMQRRGSRGKRLAIVPRGPRVPATPGLLSRCRAAELSWKKSRVHFGLVLTGEKLVDNLAHRQELVRLEPEAIGGEMEGGGLYVACQEAKVDWILVKAICDWADGNKEQHRKERQRRAARNAAEFILHAITIAPFDSPASGNGTGPKADNRRVGGNKPAHVPTARVEAPYGVVVNGQMTGPIKVINGPTRTRKRSSS